MTRKIAIIGMGISGSAVLLALAKKYDYQPPKAIQIDCYNTDQATFGRGLPFSESSDQALINSRTNRISFDYENLSEFYDWLRKYYNTEIPTYVPRRLFGEYTHERTMRLVEQLQVNVFYHKVDKIIPLGNQWLIGTTKYDEVHLATGIHSYIDPYDLEGQPQYIGAPYPLNECCHGIIDEQTAKPGGSLDVCSNLTVAVIGTGLTAIDVIKHLLNNTSNTTVFCFSRSNRFPAVRGNDLVEMDFRYLTFQLIEQLIEANHGRLPYIEFRNLFDLECHHQGIDFEHFTTSLYTSGADAIRLGLNYSDEYGKINKLMDRVTEVLTVGFPAMYESDRQSYKQDLEAMMKLTRNPMPDDSARELLTFINQERLVIVENVADIQRIAHGFILTDVKGQTLTEVDWVLNATGLDMTMQPTDQLAHYLVDARIAQVDTAGGLSIIFPGKVISPKVGNWPALFAHGMIVDGPIHQNNATIKIQQLADMVVRGTQRIAALGE